MSYIRKTLEEAMFDAKQVLDKLEWRSNGSGKPMYYQNQKDVARKIIEFNQYSAFLICAHCQSGKTGVILALFCELLEKDKSFDPRNFYVITGDDSREWIKQMETRFEKKWCEERVFKRCGGKLKSNDGHDFSNVISGRSDLYIFVDEIHLVAGKNMTISKMFEGSGIETESNFVERNIKVIGLSATPGEVYSAFNEFWAAYRWMFIKMNPETNYKGLHYLKSNDRIRQCHPVIRGNVVNQGVIDDIWRIITDIPFKTINFIRIPRSKKNGKSLDEIKTEIKMKLSDKFNEEVKVELFTQSTSASLDETIKGLDLDDITKEPKFHSFILLVDKFRVSKTLEDPRYLGVMYDRSSNKPGVVIQSFAGRMCGYKSNEHSILFTDVNIVEEYLKRWDEDCVSILSNGKNNTWVANVGESEYTSGSINRSDNTDALVKFFDTKEELIAWGSVNLGFNGGHQLSEDKSVFHECTLRVRSIQSCEWVEANRGWGFSSSHDTPRTFHCYQDVSDPSTLRYALCYRPHHVRN
jgi:hypothetical protein